MGAQVAARSAGVQRRSSTAEHHTSRVGQTAATRTSRFLSSKLAFDCMVFEAPNKFPRFKKACALAPRANRPAERGRAAAALVLEMPIDRIMRCNCALQRVICSGGPAGVVSLVPPRAGDAPGSTIHSNRMWLID